MSTIEVVKEFVKENFFFETDNQVGDDDSLLELGIIDSTGVLELIAFLEEKFDIKVEDDELLPENLDSFTKIDQFVSSKMKK